MEGRITKRNAAIVGLVLVGGALLTWAVMTPEVQAQECPSPRLIDEIEGSGNQQSPPFETTTDLFRVSYEIRAPLEEAPFFADVESADESPSIPAASISQQGSGSGETFGNAEPGRYFLNIITGGGTEYTIRIEECGDGEANPKEGKSGEGTTKDQSKVRPAPSKSPPPPPTKSPPAPPKAPPFKAGGAEDGPVPLMKGGVCPKEFPERRGNACYAR
jgi:hypothetical protein